ncbi:MAG: hypothetical protein GKR95_06865 [Gammaproteobacteria bacterium]|nr:hypothetical protein [Gammaproteobacteria bacterium]
MTTVWGRGKEHMGNAIDLLLDSERIGGAPIDITNFDQYVLARAPEQLPIRSMNDLSIAKLPLDEIRLIQWQLLKAQLQFSYATTPVIKYLWDLYGLEPKHITNWEAFQSKVLPITKKHQRLLGWMNFLPAPIAAYLCSGEHAPTQVNPNFHIEKRKWTGGTSANRGSDYVYIIIPKADWRASVQTMARILEPLKEIIKKSRFAATTYDRRHIAEPIFEEQLREYGVHLLAKPVGASDQEFYYLMKEHDVHILVAPPIDHPAKGQGIPGALKKMATQMDLVLMSSATPTAETLQVLAKNRIAVLNIDGDTASLPTYYVSVIPKDEELSEIIKKMSVLNIIQIAPSLTEVINPRTLQPISLDSWGVLLQTNWASVWENGEYVEKNGQKVWVPDGTTRLVSALKSQMIRSSATGNLVNVLETDEFGHPLSLHHKILRYNDFDLDDDLKPVLDHPRSFGGAATGGCAG